MSKMHNDPHFQQALKTSVRILTEVCHEVGTEAGYWEKPIGDGLLSLRLKRSAQSLLDVSNSAPALRDPRAYALHLIKLFDLAGAAGAPIEDVFGEILREIAARPAKRKYRMFDLKKLKLDPR